MLINTLERRRTRRSGCLCPGPGVPVSLIDFLVILPDSMYVVCAAIVIPVVLFVLAAYGVSINVCQVLCILSTGALIAGALIGSKENKFFVEEAAVASVALLWYYYFVEISPESCNYKLQNLDIGGFEYMHSVAGIAFAYVFMSIYALIGHLRGVPFRQLSQKSAAQFISFYVLLGHGFHVLDEFNETHSSFGLEYWRNAGRWLSGKAAYCPEVKDSRWCDSSGSNVDIAVGYLGVAVFFCVAWLLCLNKASFLFSGHESSSFIAMGGNFWSVACSLNVLSCQMYEWTEAYPASVSPSMFTIPLASVAIFTLSLSVGYAVSWLSKAHGDAKSTLIPLATTALVVFYSIKTSRV